MAMAAAMLATTATTTTKRPLHRSFSKNCSIVFSIGIFRPVVRHRAVGSTGIHASSAGCSSMAERLYWDCRAAGNSPVHPIGTRAMQGRPLQQAGQCVKWGDGHTVPSMERSASAPELEKNQARAQQLRITVTQNTN